jgi:hypothetical protein
MPDPADRIAPPVTPAPSLVSVKFTRDPVDGVVAKIDASLLVAEIIRLGGSVDHAGWLRGIEGRQIDANAQCFTPKAFSCQVPYMVKLKDAYRTPPTLDLLKKLAESVQTAVNLLLAQYQPVAISVTIGKTAKAGG